VALELPEEEQIELLDAHPRIGADPSTLSAHSRVEQGPAAEETAVHLAADLRRLNEAYERTFGFRFVVFVAGRPRAAILPLLEAALVADRDEELRRGLHDVVAIAADRALRS
jgi:2-oxo-4-hydroxy-4-carboxy-5-ureidoimidazoline decarboxylase